MKKNYLIPFIILTLMSCSSRNQEVSNDVQIVKDTVYVPMETLDVRIYESNKLILENKRFTWQESAYYNTIEILKNQIVIMEKLKELHK